MPDKCGKCERSFVDSDCVTKCVDCKLSFHATCTRAGSSQNFSKTRNKTLKCDVCVDETKSNASVRSTEDKDSVLEAIKTLKTDIYSKIDEKVDSVLESVNLLKDDVKKLHDYVTRIDEEQGKLHERCKNLEVANSDLYAELSDMQLRVQDAEQHSRAANIEIVGLPTTQGEDIYTCLQQIARALDVNFQSNDFSIAHRLRTYSASKHQYPPIIAQFSSRRTKEVWMRAIRAKKSLQAVDIHASLPPSSVYINEHLTPINKALLGRARQMKREKKLVFAGYFNGKVLVKKSEDAETVRVTALKDLDKYCSTRNTNT